MIADGITRFMSDTHGLTMYPVIGVHNSQVSLMINKIYRFHSFYANSTIIGLKTCDQAYDIFTIVDDSNRDYNMELVHTLHTSLND